MKRGICLIIAIAFGFSCSSLFSQDLNAINAKLDSLNKARTEADADLKALDKSIQELKRERLQIELDSLKEKGIHTKTRMDAKVRSKPSPSGLAFQIKEGTDVLVLSYDVGGYYKVIFHQDKVGYVNEVYLVENEDMLLLKSGIQPESRPPSPQAPSGYTSSQVDTPASSVRRKSFGPGVGISLGYGTTNVFYGDLYILSASNNRFHLGITTELGKGTLGKGVTERKPNYGLTVLGAGEYFNALDIGYSRLIAGHLTLGGDLSFGTRSQFTNYQDRRFKDGGYHLITDTEFTMGIGAAVGYMFNTPIEVFLGYNTLRGVNFGIRYAFEL